MTAKRVIYKEARRLLSRNVTAPELSARFFGQGGLLGTLSKAESERRALVSSELYKWLQAQYTELRQREVREFERQISELSGRLTVVVPKSLHAALKREAVHEGVSLSELIRLKLGVSYSVMVQSTVGGAKPLGLHRE
mgnify:CR=1 FL=1